jgi:quercetin dioxygenase-like cupin family protein
VEATPLHADERGAVAELAFKPNAAIAPHTNSNLAYLLVIEGGGFVRVGEERARVSAGEAVVWPPDVVHAAWTELTPMRAIVVEFGVASGDPSAEPLLLPGSAAGSPSAQPEAPVSADAPESLRADGALAQNPSIDSSTYESTEKEPW